MRPRTVTELRRALPYLLLPLVLLVAGCGLIPWDLPGFVTSSPPAGGAARADLESHRATWTESGIASYRLQLELVCFCPAENPVSVTVLDGLLTEVTAGDGRPAEEWLRSFPLTIDQIYERAAGVLDGGGTAEVTYADGGVPVSVRLDPILDAVDDELDIRMRGFTPGP